MPFRPDEHVAINGKMIKLTMKDRGVYKGDYSHVQKLVHAHEHLCPVVHGRFP